MSNQTLSSPELDTILNANPTTPATDDTDSGTQMLRLLASIDRDQVASMMTTQNFQQGDVIFREGDKGDAAYLIWSGRVAIAKGDLSSPTVLGHRGPGEFIGEMALLDGRLRSASAVALDNPRLLKMGRPSFQKLLNDNPAVGVMIMETLSARLRASDESRTISKSTEKQLSHQISKLETEKEKIEKLDRFRQETTDLIVHDLRNPLGIIYGALKLLDIVLPSEILQENQELLSVANAACDRMQQLVDSILDVAKLESDDPQLHMVATNLSSLIVNVCERQSLNLKKKEIDFRVNVSDALPTTVDVDKIDRVLSNLIDNASKFTPANGQVTVAAEAQADHILVSVTDTGPGIPAKERERIFGRFTQVAGSRPAGGRRGFGLGLSFCQLAVQAHNGRIWVEPGPKKVGSRFCLPCPKASE